MIQELKSKITDEDIFSSIVNLYKSVEWHIYIENIDQFKRTLLNSSYLYGFYKNEELIGIIRGLTDTVSLNYVQDIIVSPKHQGTGIGSQLLQYVNNKYDVRCQILLTDDEPGQLAYYKKNGFSNTRELVNDPLNCFVKFNGLELS